MTRRSLGFTLLEVLVSLVVLGLILGGLEQGLHFGMAVSRKADLYSRRAADLEAADRALRNLLAHVSVNDEGIAAEDFNGGADTMTFFGMLPDGVAAERHAEMTLLVDGDHRLVLRWRPAPHILVLEPPPFTATPILDKVDRVAFSYGPSGNGDGWKSTWSASEPPRAVRIVIVPTDGTARQWPAIIVETRSP